MTRAKVIQLGLLVLLLGGLLYALFEFSGMDSLSAGIATEAIVVLAVFGWTGTYLFRVFTGKMTFAEQRKRYRKAYDELTDSELQARFDLMSDEEKSLLMQELENETKETN